MGGGSGWWAAGVAGGRWVVMGGGSGWWAVGDSGRWAVGGGLHEWVAGDVQRAGGTDGNKDNEKDCGIST